MRVIFLCLSFILLCFSKSIKSFNPVVTPTPFCSRYIYKNMSTTMIRYHK